MITMTRTAAILFLACLCAAPLDPVPSWTYTGQSPTFAFGHAVAGLGDVNGDGFDDVAVGMFDAGDTYPGAEPNLGQTYVFLGSETGLSPLPIWASSQGGTPTTAQDVNGDGFADLFVQNPDMKAFLYLGSPDGLISPPSTTIYPDYVVQKIVGLGDTTGDGFGDAALIEAPPTGTKLILFKGTADGIRPIATLVLGLEDLINIAAAGDVNGDGLADLILSTGSMPGAGRAVVMHGSPTFFWSTEHWHSTGDGQGSFGSQMAGAGDVDGDGFDDVLIAAPLFSSVDGETGKVYLFRGSASGLGLTPSWTFVSGNQLVGTRVSSAGDVNGDGFSDVAVSAVADDKGGVVLLFLGSAAGLSPTPDQVLRGGSETVYLGWAMATAGDVDGDGASELLVGDPFAGRAYLFSGQASPTLLQSVATEETVGGCGALGAEVLIIVAGAALFRRMRARVRTTSA